MKKRRKSPRQFRTPFRLLMPAADAQRVMHLSHRRRTAVDFTIAGGATYHIPLTHDTRAVLKAELDQREIDPKAVEEVKWYFADCTLTFRKRRKRETGPKDKRGGLCFRVVKIEPAGYHAQACKRHEGEVSNGEG